MRRVILGLRVGAYINQKLPGNMIGREYYKQQRENAFISYRILEEDGIRKLFLTAGAETPSLQEQQVVDRFRLFLSDLKVILQKEQMLDSALTQTIFLADLSQKQCVRELLHELFGTNMPATTYVPQSPCSGSEFAVELIAASPRKKQELFEITRFNEQSVQLETNNAKWLFVGGIIPAETPLGSYDRSRNAFDRLEKVLTQRDFRVEQLLRVWLYQGHLVEREKDTQRYKELNRARTDFFAGRSFISDLLPKDYRGGTVYPASTGIGGDDFDLAIGGIAFLSKIAGTVAVPLENPRQTSAFDYAAVYSPQSPKFSRAMCLAHNQTARIYVSGTAGITDSESRYENDPMMQTELTLDNIAALISGENLKQHGILGFDADLSDLELARVYVKRWSDFPVIQAVCEKRCPNTPILYTIADVCRDELLVEIEGLVSAQKRGI
ncbi:MAG: hypothetical protein ACRC10_06330 [Thermoguttaceae bacterium]